jgi:hypothetical protein
MPNWKYRRRAKSFQLLFCKICSEPPWRGLRHSAPSWRRHNVPRLPSVMDDPRTLPQCDPRRWPARQDGGGARGATAGGWSKMSDEPLAREREPIERVRARLEALVMANAAPRCGARSKRTGKPCRAAAMPNGRCKVHGGKSTGPRTPKGLQRSRRANWKHGYYSREDEGGTVARAGCNTCAPLSAQLNLIRDVRRMIVLPPKAEVRPRSCDVAKVPKPAVSRCSNMPCAEDKVIRSPRRRGRAGSAAR